MRQSMAKAFYIIHQGRTEFRWPLPGGSFHQRRHWIDAVGISSAPQVQGFKGNRAAASVELWKRVR